MILFYFYFFRIKQLQRYEASATTQLPHSSSSSKLVELGDVASSTAAAISHSASTSRLPTPAAANEASLQQLVQLDSDIRMTLTELPNVWDTARKRLEQVGVDHQELFQGKFHRVTRVQ